MIDVKDLRIGNYVDYPGFSWEYPELDYEFQDAFRITSISEDNNNVSLIMPRGENGETGVDAKEINPIPITPEWLEKLGFTHDIDNLWSYKDFSIFPFLIGENGDCCSFFISYARAEEGRVWLVDCHYVHQLQNLIYSLTGQELSIGGGV